MDLKFSSFTPVQKHLQLAQVSRWSFNDDSGQVAANLEVFSLHHGFFFSGGFDSFLTSNPTPDL